MTTKASIVEIYKGFVSLIIGMKVTLAQFFKPTVTVQYPRESLKMTPRYRGHIVLKLHTDTNRSSCTACMLCERACPSDCIELDGVKLEGEKKKSVTDYMLDFTKCSLCGLCIEVCPFDALEYSKNYNLASTSKGDYQIDLVKHLEARKKQ